MEFLVHFPPYENYYLDFYTFKSAFYVPLRNKCFNFDVLMFRSYCV